MGLEKTIGKLDKYFRRLEDGKAKKIKVSHVEKAIQKLKAKEKLLHEELAEATKGEKKDRIEKKLSTVNEQIGRAEWLLDNIES